MKRALVLCAALLGCESGADAERPVPAQGGETTARPADVRAAPRHPARFGFGTPARADEIRRWDIDVNPEGRGLPPGRGGYERGAVVYARECASCHGPRGEGIAPNPRLVAAEPRDFSFADDPKLPKGIGNYWPYSTTLYDYINRAMPFATPGSLSPDDTYAVIAFLLAENGIIGRADVMDARTLPRVRMPARDRFVADDRGQGTEFR